MQRGILKIWNDEKGFGFIRQDAAREACRDVFVHISAFRGASRRPREGDAILFQRVAEDPDRPRAVNAVIEGVAVEPDAAGNWTLTPAEPARRGRRPAPGTRGERQTRQPAPPRETPRARFGWSTLVTLATILAFAALGVGHFRDDRARLWEPASGEPPPASAPDRLVEIPDDPRFRCEGKTRCTQMTSCDEALFYLENCPGSLTDGDHDGLPCEDQWCGH